MDQIPIGLPSSGKPNLRFGKRYAETNNLYGFWVIVRVISMYALGLFLAIWQYERTIPTGILAATACGWSAYRIQFILHDTSHKTLFASPRMNMRVGTAFGMLVGVNYHRYQFTHLWHHRQNGNTLDPQYPDYLGREKVSRLQYLWFVLSPLFGGRIYLYLKREIGDRTISGSQAPRPSPKWWCLFLAVQAVLVLLLIAINRRVELPLIYYGGLCTVALFLARVRTLAEHQQVRDFEPNFTRSHQWNFFDWLFLCEANFNYHLEHHLYPGVQSRMLPQISRTLLSETQNHPRPSRSMIGTVLRLWREIG